MSNVISDLTGPAEAAPAPAVDAAPEIPALAVDGAGPKVPEQALRVIRGIGAGQIPGALVLKGQPGIESGITAPMLNEMGVGLYRPKDPTLLAVAFSPKQVSVKMLQGMDAAGKLKDSFPTMTSLLQGPGGDAGGAPMAPGAEEGATGPAPEPTPPATSQVMPKPTFGSDAQAQAANERLNNLTSEPSKRKIPGAGAVLNGLVTRAT